MLKTNNVILKGANLHQAVKGGEIEGTFQTREVVIKILAEIGAKNDIEHLFEAARFTRKSDDDTKPLIKVKFWTTESKRIFFKQPSNQVSSYQTGISNLYPGTFLIFHPSLVRKRATSSVVKTKHGAAYTMAEPRTYTGT